MPKKISLVVVFMLLAGCTFAQEVEMNNLKKHVQYLSSDLLEGRGAGEKGAQRAADYIEQEFKKIGLTAAGENKTYRQSFSFKAGLHPHSSEEEKNQAVERTTENVLGFLDNQASYTLVIGAHYDHLGKGNLGNSLDPNPKGKIHNGADDNASGVAGLLELARGYASNGVRESMNFLFVAFSAEEEGLLGSKYFTEHPTMDLQNIDCMINLDMIGRLDPTTHKLIVYGIGTSPKLAALVQSISVDSIHVVTDSSGVGPSDQTSFYLKNIPVLHFFTGSHSDYHKPSDDVEKLNFSGEMQVLHFVEQVCDSLCAYPKLTFTSTRNTTQSSNPRFKVTLGVMPDYSFEGPGLRLDGVTEGRPAQVAGLQAGDIVVQLGETAVHNIQNYMEGLSKFKKGDTTSVKVKRGEQELTFQVTF